MNIKISVTEGIVKSLPREVVNQCLEDLIDDMDDMDNDFSDGAVPAEIINLDGYPEFLIAFNPATDTAFAMLTSEEKEVCPEGLLSTGVKLCDYSAAEYN